MSSFAFVDFLMGMHSAYSVYRCDCCGKSKPNPYVIFAKGFGCECEGENTGPDSQHIGSGGESR